ncbi:MAG: carbohydrate kinase family protein [Phenylobacterium sp.]|uniref:carbohydrate kinase family protein n=1 Tax=Phenylobacterium sp. TaxID=1871053 RepID=UPI00391DACBE
MIDLAIIGALALDRPIRLDGPLMPGARMIGRSLDGALAGRLGGGGANAATALARAGRPAALLAYIADDADGARLLDLAKAAGLDTRFVVRRPGASRTTLILLAPDGERAILTLDPEPVDLPPLPAPAPTKGLLVRAAYPEAEAWARACDGPVIVHWPCGAYAGPCDVLVGSWDDAAPDMRAEPLGVGRRRFGPRLRWVVLTQGADGARAFGDGETLSVIPPAVKVADATGAGDVFAAGLLDALSARAEMAQALAHACLWGATAASLEGSAPVSGAFRAFRPASP